MTRASDTRAGWSPVYRVVRRIPAGQVSTYGEVAARAGMPRAARQVGWALNALGPEDDVPWHRVINAKGEVSSRGVREFEGLQRALLESEGVEFDARGRVDFGQFGWAPGTRRRSKPKAVREPKEKPRGASARAKKPKKRETPRKAETMKTLKAARARKVGAK